MNVNVKVSLTDEQRETMFRRLNFDKKGLVSRKDVNDFVQTKISQSLNGDAEVQGDFKKDSTVGEFIPSRGDEPYLLKVKDESLRAIHSRMLDCIEDYETAVQREIEKNTRKSHG